jgi:hypothetical protein
MMIKQSLLNRTWQTQQMKCKNVCEIARNVQNREKIIALILFLSQKQRKWWPLLDLSAGTRSRSKIWETLP